MRTSQNCHPRALACESLVELYGGSVVAFSLTMPMKYAHERYLGRPSCPRCGVLMVVPESSQYESEDRVRHAWSCVDCRYDFHTLVELPARCVA
jgi:hypothetical protein